MKVPIALTGLGVCSPLGEGITANWKNLIEPIQRAPFPDTLVGRRGTAGASGAIHLARTAVEEALRGAGFWDGQQLQGINPERLGCTVSASKPLLKDVIASERSERSNLDVKQRDCFGGTECLAMTALQISPPEVINESLRRYFGIEGESRNVVAACATGSYSIALAASWIDQGLCDAVIAGSVEPSPHPLIEAGFRQMGVLSEDGVTRPFDLQRSGFGMGAGAGAVVLESATHARSRGRSVDLCLSGWGMGADGHSPVAFNSDGQHIADVIKACLQKAGLSPEQIQHINSHGTATRLNDRIETQAVQKAFGRAADRLQISATKASTGHLLGAAGSVEFVFTAMALQNQFVPPTATLKHPDPECPLDYTPRHGHAARIEHALSLSFGFGGSIGVLAVSPF